MKLLKRASWLIAITSVLAISTTATIANGASPTDVQAASQADLKTTQDALTAAFPDLTFTGIASTEGRSGYGEHEDSRDLVQSLLAKAAPDECFAGIGVNYPSGSPCPEGSQPKTNEGYAWGMTQTSNAMWIGTGSNVQCLVEGTYLNSTNPTQNADAVCEMGQSMGSRLNSVPAGLGDFRPPHAYRYDIKTKSKVNLVASLSGADLTRLSSTIGFRAAGTNGKVVYFAGPSFNGINLFAFSASNGSFLGSTSLTSFTNIRSFVFVKNALYTGVANRTGGGSVLRFDGTTAAPFAFTTVGSNIDGEVATLATHKGRIYVSTWPNAGNSGSPAAASSLWMSPKLPERGLTTSNAGSWSKVWSVNAYEPDPVVAATYGGGALQSFNGKLYWGTMHVPMVSAAAKWKVYGAPENQTQAIADVLGTYRAVSLFSVDDFAARNPKVELLYGQGYMPVFDPTYNGTFGGWKIAAGPMGAPKMGLSGFGNPFNNYVWSMSVYKNQLFIGTMDWSYLAAQSLPADLVNTGITLGDITLPSASSFFGADLFRLGEDSSKAKAVSMNGLSNNLNYGIRTMESTKDGLYLGTANPMNLSPVGGWELIKLK